MSFPLIGDSIHAYQLHIKDEGLSQLLMSNSAQRPSKRQLKILRDWIIQPALGGNFLVGDEALIWDDANSHDFIGPLLKENDPFTSFLAGPILSWYHNLHGHKKEVSLHGPILVSVL